MFPFGQKPATQFGQATSTPAFGQSTNTSVFGQGTNAPAFGTPSNQPAFGAPTNQPAFGAPTNQPAFGAPTNQPAFGAPTNQPGFGTPANQSAFGTSTASQSTFGTQSQSTFGTPQPTFGTPTTTASFGGQTTTAFGTSNASFSTPSTTPGFGASTNTPAFGATPTPAFGNTSTPAFGNTSTPLTFGTNQQKPAFGGATTTAAQPSGFQFGSGAAFGATSTTATPSLGSSTTQPSLTFTVPQTTSALSFGAAKPGAVNFGTFTTTSTSTQPSLSFGSSLTTKPITTQASAGFSFGTSSSTLPATTTSVPTSPGSLSTVGLSSFTGAGLSLGSAIGGKSILTITGNTATPLYGSKTADLQAGRGTGQAPPKCQNVPQVVVDLVESFKNNMKDQKHLCLEVSRASLKPISKISTDAENVKRSIMKLERAVNKNKLLNSRLKEETIKALADVEIAQKAMDIPGGFPSENSIITDYFLQLANQFQQQVLALRVELESTEKSVLCELNPVAFTPQELSTTMQRLYECFVALAGRFQFVHAQISNLKVQHLELRRKKFEDYMDIFNKKSIISTAKPLIQNSNPEGPTQFSGPLSLNSVMSSLGYSINGNTTSSIFSSPNVGTSLPFGSTFNQSAQSTFLSTSPQQSTPGSKRGKR